jgi:hypothetical protein
MTTANYYFIPRILLWLVTLFTLWALLAPWLLVPVAGAADSFLTHLFPHAIAAVEQQGTKLEMVTQFIRAPTADLPAPAGAELQLVVTVDALQYAYGLPLLLALTLATPISWGRRMLSGAIGSVAVFPVVVWGVVCETLKVLVFQVAPEVSVQMKMGPLQRELLALGYQLGYLILPSLIPILIWGLLQRKFLRTWMPVHGASQ